MQPGLRWLCKASRCWKRQRCRLRRRLRRRRRKRRFRKPPTLTARLGKALHTMRLTHRRTATPMLLLLATQLLLGQGPLRVTVTVHRPPQPCQLPGQAPPVGTSATPTLVLVPHRTMRRKMLPCPQLGDGARRSGENSMVS